MIASIIAALVGGLPSFVLRFVGSGILETTLKHFERKADSETERQRIKADVRIKRIAHESKRRELQKELQLRDMDFVWFRACKFSFISTAVAYYAGITWLSIFDANDRWGLEIDKVPLEVEIVLGSAIGYMFLDEYRRKGRR